MDEPPEDLVRLQCEFFELDARCGTLAGEELAAVQARRLEVVLAKYNHPWWETVPKWYDGDVLLRSRAKQTLPAAGGAGEAAESAAAG